MGNSYYQGALRIVGSLAIVLLLSGSTPTPVPSPYTSEDGGRFGFCMDCEVDGGPYSNGMWDLTWWPMAYEDCLEQGGCAYCNDGDYQACLDPDNEWTWDGPCDMPCCGEGLAHESGDRGPAIRDASCGEALSVNADDPAAVIEALQTEAGALKYNAKRQALQVVSCSGAVLRSTQLSAKVIEAVEQYQATVNASQ